MNEVGVEFTLQELGVLANLLELPTAAGIEQNPIDDLPVAAREPVVDSVLASLSARQIVAGEGNEVEVAEPIKVIMGAASVPGLVAVVSRQVDTVVDTTFLSVTPDLGVEVASVAHTVFRLTPFASSDLLARVLRLSDLHPVPGVESVEPLELPQAQLEQCAESMLAGDDEAALLALGGPSDSTEAFLQALKAKRSSSQVTILHKPGDGRVEGGAIAWIDAGFRGVWTTEAVEEDGELTGIIRIESADSRELARELFTYLPDAFSQEDPLAEQN